MAVVIDIKAKNFNNHLRSINALLKRTRDYKKPLAKSAAFFQKEIQKQFDKGVNPLGESWEEISDLTFKIFRKQDTEDPTPLSDTNKLRNSFKSNVENGQLMIENTDSKAAAHQFGGKGSKDINVPQRQILPINQLPPRWGKKLHTDILRHIKGNL